MKKRQQKVGGILCKICLYLILLSLVSCTFIFNSSLTNNMSNIEPYFELGFKNTHLHTEDEAVKNSEFPFIKSVIIKGNPSNLLKHLI